MNTRALIAAVAAAGISILAVSAGDGLAAQVTELKGKYSKIKLDGICAREGGQSYGTADTAYGCTKGSNTVECNKDGSCKGYNFARMTPGGRGELASPESILQLPEMRSTAAGGTTGSSGQSAGDLLLAPQ